MARQLDTVPTAEAIADAFEAEASSHFQIATRNDPRGQYRLLVRKHLPPGVSVSSLLKDRPALISAISDALATRNQQETELKDAKLRAEREGAEMAQSGEWTLVIPRGYEVYEGWDDSGWYLWHQHSAISESVVLWDGQNKRKLQAVRITKEQAAERLMAAASLMEAAWR